MSALDIYFIFVVDSIISSSILASISLSVIFVFSFIAYMAIIDFCDYSKKDGYVKRLQSYQRKMAVAILFFFAVFTFTPSSKVIAAMYLIPAMANNEDLQEIFGDSIDILKAHVEDWKDDIIGAEEDLDNHGSQ